MSPTCDVMRVAGLAGFQYGIGVGVDFAGSHDALRISILGVPQDLLIGKALVAFLTF